MDTVVISVSDREIETQLYGVLDCCDLQVQTHPSPDLTDHLSASLVVLDAQMTDKLSTTVARIRMNAPNASVLVLASPEQMPHVFDAGADDYAPLPIVPAFVRYQVKRLLKKPPSFILAIREAAAAISQTIDLETVLQRILELVYRAIPGSDFANIVLLDDDRLFSLVDVRGRAFNDETTHQLTKFQLADIPNLYEMYKTHQPVIVSDTATSEVWVTLPGEEWIRSCASAPIIVDQVVIGFISLVSGTPHAFTQWHTNALQTFANQMGVAIYNARLFDALRGEAVHLEERFINSTAELEQERAMLQTTLDSISDAVLLYDSQGLVFANNSAHSLLGYTIEELHDPANLDALYNLPTEAREALFAMATEAIVADGLWHEERVFCRKDGTEFDAAVMSTRVNSPDGVLRGSVTVVRDISHEKALRERLKLFVAYASHELGTPITNLKTRLYLMRRKPDDLERHLGVFETVVEHMEHIVKNLLQISRVARGEIQLDVEPTDVPALLKKIIDLQSIEAQEQGIALHASLQPTPPFEIDQQTITQVVMNLISNALKFSADGSRVDVTWTLQNHEDKNWGVVTVRDEGIGILEEHLPYLFQAFYRVERKNRPGSGLGLTIASEIARQHGGQITVESTLGVGSTFRLWLPQPSP